MRIPTMEAACCWDIRSVREAGTCTASTTAISDSTALTIPATPSSASAATTSVAASSGLRMPGREWPRRVRTARCRSVDRGATTESVLRLESNADNGMVAFRRQIAICPMTVGDRPATCAIAPGLPGVWLGGRRRTLGEMSKEDSSARELLLAKRAEIVAKVDELGAHDP